MAFGFDIDGVLADSDPQILLAGIRAGYIPKGTCMNDVCERIDDQFSISFHDVNAILDLELFRHIVPNWDVIRDIRRWIDDGEDIVYCTARSDESTPGVQDLTLECLDIWGVLEGSHGVRFMDSKDKYRLADEFPLFGFTDDYHVVLDSMEGVVPHLFLMETRTNQTVTHRPRMSWEDIAERIDIIRLYGSDSIMESTTSA